MTISTPPPGAAGNNTHRLPRWLRWIALLLLCAAYLQGGWVKLFDFSSAMAEMQHFGLSPSAPLAAATIALELGASAAILTGIWRWLGALALAAFTLMATFLANRFWSAPPEAQFAMANAFFEHLGLVGGFLLVAWDDLRTRRQP
ncbi:DoxX family protein [Pandoraea horticolens]|uniref:DoxX family protein n=1 Tax=Pandoraea horticolens TaxID=2508298 RepID=A0A5E4SQT7_9BURK|nr:DoxX family protein [Pandoraea horticolens]VVD76708.1 DoxX family protein [Pandoraea horticolens]